MKYLTEASTWAGIGIVATNLAMILPPSVSIYAKAVAGISAGLAIIIREGKPA